MRPWVVASWLVTLPPDGVQRVSCAPPGEGRIDVDK